MCAKVLGIVGSIRSNHKKITQLKEIVLSCNTQDALNNSIQHSGHSYSNTDIALAHAMLGAKIQGAQVDMVCITDIFEHTKENIYNEALHCESIDDLANIDTLAINHEQFLNFCKKVQVADGVVLGTPVYFGDRSSVANKFFQLAQTYKLLEDKAFGVVSCGAKRNGGQETTNIYSLYEAMAQGAVVVGNGPKTAQYGGTVWAGDIGTAIKDEFGQETSYGAGRQTAMLANILKLGLDTDMSTKPKISVVITMDTDDRKYEAIAKDYFEKFGESCDIVFYNLLDGDIYRCLACSVCPSPKYMQKYINDEAPYNCIIQTSKDSMKNAQSIIAGSDCVVLVGANTSSHLTYRYQAFMERTRFIRHDDFQWTNIPFVGLLINEVGALSNPLFHVKVLTSFIRHNTFFLKPLQIVMQKDMKIFESSFSEYISKILSIKKGREVAGPVCVSYKATGYGDTRLDDTIKWRK